MEECYMKISVVIAYHDEKQYIKDCLASLAEQTFQDFEVILVCDGCGRRDSGDAEHCYRDAGRKGCRGGEKRGNRKGTGRICNVFGCRRLSGRGYAGGIGRESRW